MSLGWWAEMVVVYCRGKSCKLVFLSTEEISGIVWKKYSSMETYLKAKIKRKMSD